MAVALRLQFSGIGRAEYDRVNAKLGIDMSTGAGDWPPGLLSHAAGELNGSLVVLEIWESREAQGSFMQGRLGAAIAQAGVTAVPQIEWIDLFSYNTPNR